MQILTYFPICKIFLCAKDFPFLFSLFFVSNVPNIIFFLFGKRNLLFSCEFFLFFSTFKVFKQIYIEASHVI